MTKPWLSAVATVIVQAVAELDDCSWTAGSSWTRIGVKIGKSRVRYVSTRMSRVG